MYEDKISKMKVRDIMRGSKEFADVDVRVGDDFVDMSVLPPSTVICCRVTYKNELIGYWVPNWRGKKVQATVVQAKEDQKKVYIESTPSGAKSVGDMIKELKGV